MFRDVAFARTIPTAYTSHRNVRSKETGPAGQTGIARRGGTPAPRSIPTRRVPAHPPPRLLRRRQRRPSHRRPERRRDLRPNLAAARGGDAGPDEIGPLQVFRPDRDLGNRSMVPARREASYGRNHVHRSVAHGRRETQQHEELVRLSPLPPPDPAAPEVRSTATNRPVPAATSSPPPRCSGVRSRRRRRPPARIPVGRFRA